MESKLLRIALFLFILSASGISSVAGRALAGLADEKNYYSPDPNANTPPPTPRHSHRNPSCDAPSHGGSGGAGSPSHDGGNNGTPPTTPSNGGGSYGTPPTTPSHGGGGNGDPHTTPSHGGSYNTPPTTPSHDGGSYGSPPSHDGGNHGVSPTTPSHGGYYNTPPTTPISPPITTTPSPLVPLTPPTYTTPSPPFVITDPNTPPTYTTPSPPLLPEPNTPPFFPFTCNYWFTHPTAIWVLFGYWGTVGQVFGPPAANFPIGRSFGLVQALGNTRGDGYGALLREGTAALLNSMASSRFYFSTQQVRDGFNGGMRSEKTAAAQAKLFQKANEGHLKH